MPASQEKKRQQRESLGVQERWNFVELDDKNGGDITWDGNVGGCLGGN